MKLKLETDEDVTILTVTETVEPKHFPILKAGLKKLIDAQKKQLLLDLIQIDPASLKNSIVIQEFLGIPKWAQDNGATLTLVSSIDGLGTAKTRQDALKAVKSPLGRLLQQEARLQAELKMLEAQKIEMNQKMNAAGSGGPDIKSLKKENSHLNRAVAHLENSVRRYLKKRTDPAKCATAKAKTEAVDNLLMTVLEQEGILPVKPK